MRKRIILILVLLSLPVFSAGKLNVGNSIPEVMMVRDQNRALVNLNDIYMKKSKPLLINFFSITCKPCTKEIPEIQQLFEKYGAKVNMVLISIDQGRSNQVQGLVDEYIKELNAKITIPVYINGANMAMDFGGTSIVLPSTFVVSREGKIIMLFSGYSEQNMKTLDNICRKF
jgi:thiol-disulfide isomerase/thioredoxin